MLYYHVTPTENVPAILAEGLTAVFFDVQRQYVCTSMSRAIAIAAQMAEWGEHGGTTEYSMLEVWYSGPVVPDPEADYDCYYIEGVVKPRNVTHLFDDVLFYGRTLLAS